MTRGSVIAMALVFVLSGSVEAAPFTFRLDLAFGAPGSLQPHLTHGPITIQAFGAPSLRLFRDPVEGIGIEGVGTTAIDWGEWMRLRLAPGWAWVSLETRGRLVYGRHPYPVGGVLVPPGGLLPLAGGGTVWLWPAGPGHRGSLAALTITPVHQNPYAPAEDVPAVPEPSTLALLGAGLVALGRALRTRT